MWLWSRSTHTVNLATSYVIDVYVVIFAYRKASAASLSSLNSLDAYKGQSDINHVVIIEQQGMPDPGILTDCNTIASGTDTCTCMAVVGLYIGYVLLGLLM